MEFECTYGSSYTPSIIYTYKKWYVIDGSCNVNRTYDDLYDGIHVEEIRDYDCFTCAEPIESLEQLIKAVES